jgi:hypothetical protein
MRLWVAGRLPGGGKPDAVGASTGEYPPAAGIPRQLTYRIEEHPPQG